MWCVPRCGSASRIPIPRPLPRTSIRKRPWSCRTARRGATTRRCNMRARTSPIGSATAQATSRARRSSRWRNRSRYGLRSVPRWCGGWHAARAPWSAVARNIVTGRSDVPWHVILSTSGVLIALIVVSAALGVKYHVLGTDKVGQDVLYQAVKSIRTGLVIGTLTTLVMLPFAVLLGIMAGYFRGWIDDLIQYVYTTLNSIPGVLLIAAAVLILQVYMETQPELFDTIAHRADMRLLILCIILGITSWTGHKQQQHNETKKQREVEY